MLYVVVLKYYDNGKVEAFYMTENDALERGFTKIGYGCEYMNDYDQYVEAYQTEEEAKAEVEFALSRQN